jgi:hypothetical protein
VPGYRITANEWDQTFGLAAGTLPGLTNSFLLLILAILMAACRSTPVEDTRPRPDPTVEEWYRSTTNQLSDLNRQVKTSLASGKKDEAAALIVEGEKLSHRILSVPHPTLGATKAASDLDEMYGEMLLTNKHYGWARLSFQKNVVRWKYWKPRTEETAALLRQAEAHIAECDRLMK